jgi:threonine dehydrogenase-like Zn-dependent dehydrogenase
VAKLFTTSEAAKCGVELVYKNTSDPTELLALTGGKGYNDVFVNVPVPAVIQLADKIMGKDGCLNFFSGPTDPAFTAPFNFYNVHYASTHVVGVSGGNADDMLESLRLMEQGTINPAAMITHVGGMDSVIDTVLNLEKIPGGKKLIYTHIDMPLTAIEDFGKIDSPLFKKLADIVKKNNGLWCLEAEKVLLSQ